LDKYEPKQTEQKWYEIWEKNGYFHADENSGKPPFSIVIPPPNVTGSLHMGHALNNTLQDILARFKRARGFNVLWLPGCDHAGIATQNVVERELKKQGKTKHDLGREEFLKTVWDWKDKYGKTIMMQLRKLGSSCDWQRERFTMDAGLSDAVKEVFVRLYREGLIYRGDYIINWCPRCHTALSDIEVEHRDVNGHFYHIRYPFKDREGYIQVATTRPETMLGDTAVAVHPEDPRYKDIPSGTLLMLPETGRYIPLIKDEYVDREFGTGAVKITPAHDPNDFLIGLKHKLEIINVMTESARMNERAGINGKYAGLERFEARKKLVDTLKEQGYVPQIDDHKHAVGHCYRCSTIVEPYVSTQWFVKIKPLAEIAVKVVEEGRIKFTPDHWKKVYFEWMNIIKDWCISRQLWWGHRIPAWYCDCGEIIVDKEEPKSCPKCKGKNLKQDEDVLDTWFSSALWPFSTMGWPDKTKELEKFYPTSVLVTGWDILFFWVARMIMMGMKFMDAPPFREVAINSLVGDAEGKKMSKSKGNVIDPLDIMANYSADSLRFTMATLETQARYIAFTEERLKSNHNFMNKIWNASKFVISNLEGFTPVDLESEYGKLKLPERWILGELAEMNKKAAEGLEKFRLSEVSLGIYEFFWHKFCDWYVEASKTEVYGTDAAYANLVKNVLARVLKDSLVMMHPFIPFITEEIYQNLPKQCAALDTIMKEKWPGVPETFAPQADMKIIEELVYHIRNIRGEFGVSPADKVEVVADAGANSGLFDANMAVILLLSKASSVVYSTQRPEGSAEAVSATAGRIWVVIKGKIDTAKEMARLKAASEKLMNGVKSVSAKLENKNFTAKAPEKLIQEEKAKMERMKADAAKLNEMAQLLAGF